MTFNEFLTYIREKVGTRCTDAYWAYIYNSLEDKSLEGIRKETPFMVVRAAGNDYGRRQGRT